MILALLRTLVSRSVVFLARVLGEPLLIIVLTPFAVLGGVLTLALDLLTAPWARLFRDRRVPAAPARRSASIITVSWNGKHFLERLLPSLEEAVRADGGDHEIIVVDNGSDDDTVAYVSEFHPDVKLVSLPQNRYFVRGNLAGVQAATKDVLVFVNNDMVVRPEFLTGLLDGFDSPDVFGVSSEIFFANPEKRREETGKTRGRLEQGFLQLAHEEPCPDDVRLGYTPTFWAGGGSSAFDRAKFLAVGGFDTLYDPFYLEDAGLSYQAWKRGWRVLFTPKSSVVHEHRGTSSKLFGHEFVDNTIRRNQHLFLWRNLTDPGKVLRYYGLFPMALLWRAGCSEYGYRRGILFELRALVRALPRYPWALAKRVVSRRHQRRSDSRVFEVANSLHRHRVDSGWRPDPAKAREGGLRLLVLSARLPRLDTDGSWVLFNLLRELSRRHHVTLFSFLDAAEDEVRAEPLREFCDRVVTHVRTSNPERLDLHHREPDRLGRDYSAGHMFRAVRRLLDSTDFDLVQVEYAEMAYLAHGLVRDLPSVYTVHEPLSLFHRRRLELARGWNKVREGMGWARNLVSEMRAMSSFRHLITLSHADEEYLRAYGPGPEITSIPSGVDITRFRPRPEIEERPIVTFVGFFGHEPNVDAATWLAREIFPLVRARVPEAVLRLVGKEPTSEVCSLAGEPGVEVTGFVPDIHTCIAESAAIAVPIRLGAGLRGKILEAWASGKAVVTTRRAAEGFDFEPGRHALVADDPGGFAEHLVSCLKRPELRARLGHEARALVEARYSPDTAARRYERVYEKVLAAYHAACRGAARKPRLDPQGLRAPSDVEAMHG